MPLDGVLYVFATLHSVIAHSLPHAAFFSPSLPTKHDLVVARETSRHPGHFWPAPQQQQQQPTIFIQNNTAQDGSFCTAAACPGTSSAM